MLDMIGKKDNFVYCRT